MKQIETERWKSAVVSKGPFKAELGGFPNNGWWVVVNADGKRIDDSGDGRFFEASARFIADSLNQQARIEELEALAQALIDDVRARYPGEELRCPHMIALDEALKGTDDG